MKLATIIASIEQNRSVIDAQVQAIGTLSPRPLQLRTDPASAHAPNSSLFEQIMLSDMQNAAAVLATLAEAEGMVRRSFAAAAATAPTSHDPNIIDVEAVELKEPAAKGGGAT